MSKSSERFIAILIAVSSMYFLALVGFNLVSGTFNTQDKSYTQAAPYTATQDADLLAKLNSLAVPNPIIDSINLEYVDSYEGSDRLHGQQWQESDTSGVMHPHISIRRGLSANDLNVTLAHEYLHVIWDSIPAEQRVSLNDSLTIMYSTDAPLQNRMQHYVEKEHSFGKELFSIYCTESQDSYLKQNVLSACNQFIDRSKLEFLR